MVCRRQVLHVRRLCLYPPLRASSGTPAHRSTLRVCGALRLPAFRRGVLRSRTALSFALPNQRRAIAEVISRRGAQRARHKPEIQHAVEEVRRG